MNISLIGSLKFAITGNILILKSTASKITLGKILISHSSFTNKLKKCANKKFFRNFVINDSKPEVPFSNYLTQGNNFSIKLNVKFLNFPKNTAEKVIL